MIKHKLLLLLISTIHIATYASHKIIYLITPARSLSTAFLRMMHARGDFTVLNEPALPAFFKSIKPIDPNLKSMPGTRKTWPETKLYLQELLLQKDLFVKEMALAAHKFFIDDDIIRNPNAYFVFMARHPHDTVLSLYKKASVDHEIIRNGDTYMLWGLDFAKSIGFQAMYEFWQQVKAKAVNSPLLLLTEDLGNFPEQTIQKFCNHVKIPFKKEFLSWPDLGDSFTGYEEWGETKPKDLTHLWHGDAIHSTHFSCPPSYHRDTKGNPTFSETKSSFDRDACQSAYHQNMIYYNMLLAEAKK